MIMLWNPEHLDFGVLHEDSIRPLGIVFGLKTKGEKDCGLVVLRGDQPSPSHD